MKSNRPYAEDIKHYWKSSRSSAGKWLERAENEVAKVGGNVLAHGIIASPSGTDSESAYMFAFELDGDAYKVIWPVLKSKAGNDAAARRQAATMLYHDVKARCMSSLVLGTRVAFASFLLTSKGETVGDYLADKPLSSIASALSVKGLLPKGK